MGFDMSFPGVEPAPYDSIFDDGERPAKVRAKYVGGDQAVPPKIRSNSKGYVMEHDKENAYEWMYESRKDGGEYLIDRCLVQRDRTIPVNKVCRGAWQSGRMRWS